MRTCPLLCPIGEECINRSICFACDLQHFISRWTRIFYFWHKLWTPRPRHHSFVKNGSQKLTTKRTPAHVACLCCIHWKHRIEAVDQLCDFYIGSHGWRKLLGLGEAAGEKVKKKGRQSVPFRWMNGSSRSENRQWPDSRRLPASCLLACSSKTHRNAHHVPTVLFLLSSTKTAFPRQLKTSNRPSLSYSLNSPFSRSASIVTQKGKYTLPKPIFPSFLHASHASNVTITTLRHPHL